MQKPLNKIQNINNSKGSFDIIGQPQQQQLSNNNMQNLVEFTKIGEIL